jgi:hypothetical protein
MTPEVVLRLIVRRLPERRREWGQAMEAELAGLDSGRWRFAMSCARGVLGRPETIVRLVPSLLAAGAAGIAVWLLAAISDGPVRLEAIAMVSVLGVVAWFTRPARLMGAAALAILGAEGLIFLRGLQGESDATAGIVIWTTMLSIYALALTRAPARGFAIGAAVAAAWLVATVIDPGVPTSTGPALLAIAFAAICARGRIAGLCAAATAALLIAVLIDGPLSLLSPWVANSAPPVYPPESVDRLVDSVGIWLFGTLIAAALGLAIRANRHANVMPVLATAPAEREPGSRSSRRR